MMQGTARVEQVLRHLRQRHPELRFPATWPVVQRIAAREGVAIVHGPLGSDACLLASQGTAVIVLNCDLHPRRHTYRTMHELAHWWLHCGDHEPVYYQMSDSAEDHRESEAEELATRLLQGW